MNFKLLDYLCCPKCGGELSLGRFQEVLREEGEGIEAGEFSSVRNREIHKSQFYPAQNPQEAGKVCWRVDIVEGELRCRGCRQAFPIRNSVPRFVDFHDQRDELADIKQQTKKNFGYEWLYYDRHGLDQHGKQDRVDVQRTVTIERRIFHKKALIDDDREFRDKLVLDAGCGNGRYLYQTHLLGAEVIGVDISDSVEAAEKNLSKFPNAHVIQADLFHLPLKDHIFDRVFSIGVLMHTGNSRQAFSSIARKLKRDCIITVHVYKRGNFLYEFIDRKLRKRTVNMDLDRLMQWSRRGAAFARLLLKTKYVTLGYPLIYSLFNCFIRLEMHTHNVFDWYSAPVASHHTYAEVYEWFRENQIRVTGDRDRKKSIFRRLLKSPASGVTVKGIKR